VTGPKGIRGRSRKRDLGERRDPPEGRTEEGLLPNSKVSVGKQTGTDQDLFREEKSLIENGKKIDVQKVKPDGERMTLPPRGYRFTKWTQSAFSAGLLRKAADS